MLGRTKAKPASSHCELHKPQEYDLLKYYHLGVCVVRGVGEATAGKLLEEDLTFDPFQ